MNAYKLNGISGQCFRKAICDGLDIFPSDIYRVVKSINSNGIIELKSGNKFRLELKRI